MPELDQTDFIRVSRKQIAMIRQGSVEAKRWYIRTEAFGLHSELEDRVLYPGR